MSKNKAYRCRIYNYSFSHCIVVLLIKLLARYWYGTLFTIAIFQSKAFSLQFYSLKNYRLPCYSDELILALIDQRILVKDWNWLRHWRAWFCLCFLQIQPKPQTLKNYTARKKLEWSQDTWWPCHRVLNQSINPSINLWKLKNNIWLPKSA